MSGIKIAKRLARSWKHGRAGAHSCRGYTRKTKHKERYDGDEGVEDESDGQEGRVRPSPLPLRRDG